MKKIICLTSLLLLASASFARDYSRTAMSCKLTASFQDLDNDETLYSKKSVIVSKQFVYTTDTNGIMTFHKIENSKITENGTKLDQRTVDFLSNNLAFSMNGSHYTAELNLEDIGNNFLSSESRQAITSLMMSLVNYDDGLPLRNKGVLDGDYVTFSDTYSTQNYSDNSRGVEDRNVLLFSDNTYRQDEVHASFALNGRVAANSTEALVSSSRYQVHFSPAIYNGASYHLNMKCGPSYMIGK